MTRTVIDVDDHMLAAAAEIFGTTTKVATVNAALEDAVKRRKRASFLEWLADGGLPDLTGPVDSADDPHHDA
ncbi:MULTISPECIES: type II toxin-antitoxin system VapB family antitoxin [unclassified Streptomyces]|uniref:type II toxin-antitoxin system VapB family antitoxin n=1 Tax=unclassified Streptomyces TaxID=2593676 RepID=UPI0037F569A9